MKNRIILFVLIIVGYFNSQAQETWTLEGSISNPQATGTVQLKKYDVAENQYVFIQNITINEEGDFQAEIDFTEPELFAIKVYENRSIILGIEGAENVVLTVSNGGGSFAYEVDNSPSSQKIKQFQGEMNQLQMEYFADLKKRADKAMAENDQAAMEDLNKEQAEILPLFIADFESLIRNLGVSTAGYYALTFTDINKMANFWAEQAETYSQERPDWSYTQQIQHAVLLASSLSFGNKPPAFSFEFNHQTQTLADFKGKYVLIDFWASWCLPCRSENPKLGNLYQKYQENGFEIISISLDEDTNKWEEATQKDGIVWASFLDDGFVIKEDYGVSAMPSNFLLDREGKIIAKNINAEQLASILAEKLN